MTSEMGDYPSLDADLMQRIFQTPLKRQWCRSGMSYNPVLGTCTLSLAVSSAMTLLELTARYAVSCGKFGHDTSGTDCSLCRFWR